MTILDLMKKAKENNTTLTSMVFENWHSLDQGEQSAIAIELCSILEDYQQNDLIHSLYENQTHLFIDHYLEEINKLLAIGEGVSVAIKDLEDLFTFINSTTVENDFEDDIAEMVDTYISMAICYEEDEIEENNFYTITCDFITCLEKIKDVLKEYYY